MLSDQHTFPARRAKVFLATGLSSTVLLANSRVIFDHCSLLDGCAIQCG